jgi:hypothetical protein
VRPCWAHGKKRPLSERPLHDAYFFFGVDFGLSGACVRTDPARLLAAFVDELWDSTFPAREASSRDDFSFFAMIFSLKT